MYVKASTITNLSDARYFAAQFTVEWMGFCLDEGNPDYMPVHVVKALSEWVEGPKITGEFGLQDEAVILNAIGDIGLKAIQLPMFSNIPTGRIKSEVEVIQEIVVEKNAESNILNALLEQMSARADYILLDFVKNSWSLTELLHHKSVSLDWLQRSCQQYKILLAADFQPAQLQSLTEAVSPFGLSIRGGEEERPGYKSYEELNAIFDTL